MGGTSTVLGVVLWPRGEAPETVTEEMGRDDAPTEQEKPVSWWRKLFS